MRNQIRDSPAEHAGEILRHLNKGERVVDLMDISKRLFNTVNGLTGAEIDQLNAWAADERDSLLAWIRWSRNKKFKGGIREKMAAKTGFLAAFNIVMAVHGLKPATQSAKLFFDEQGSSNSVDSNASGLGVGGV